MPSAKYYRNLAQLCAHLGASSIDPGIGERYFKMALGHLAKAEELEPSTGRINLDIFISDIADIDRTPGARSVPTES